MLFVLEARTRDGKKYPPATLKLIPCADHALSTQQCLQLLISYNVVFTADSHYDNSFEAKLQTRVAESAECKLHVYT